jgi:hypothetical protein
MPEAPIPAVEIPERTMPKPVIAAGLVLVGVLLGVGLSAKLLPVRKVLYPVEGPPRPCDECERKRQLKESAEAAADTIVQVVSSHEAAKAEATAAAESSDETAPAST